MPTSYSTSNALVKHYQRPGLVLQTEEQAFLMSLIGDADDSVIVTLPGAGVERGSDVEVRFQPQNASPLPTGAGTKSFGNEGSDTQKTDIFGHGYLRLGSRGDDLPIFEQTLLEFSIRESMEMGLANDAAKICEYSWMHTLAGYTPVNDLTAGGPRGTGYSDGKTNYTMSWCNAAIEPDTFHHFFCPASDGTASASEAVVAADESCILTHDFVVNTALRKVIGTRYGCKWPIAPASTPWGKGYVCVCSSKQMADLKSFSGDNQIVTLAQACIEGGMDPENSTLWSLEGFKMQNIFYLQHPFVTLGTTGTAGLTTASAPRANVERALLLGARSAHVRWGEGFTREDWLGYKETEFERRLSMFCDTVVGAKVCVVDGQRWGSAVISSYSDVTTHPYD